MSTEGIYLHYDPLKGIRLEHAKFRLFRLNPRQFIWNLNIDR